MNPRLSIIPAGAVTDPRLEGRDLQALCLLGRHIDDAGWCRRSQVRMAREIGCARSTLQASIDRLVAAGWVEKQVNIRPSGGDAAYSFRVILDPPADDASLAEVGAAEDMSESAEFADDTPPAGGAIAGTGGPAGGADLSAGVPAEQSWQGVAAPQNPGNPPISEGEEGVPDKPRRQGGADLSAGGILPEPRQGVPIYGSAPMLTTPLNVGERGARARPRGNSVFDPDAPLPDEGLFAELARRHPTAAHDDLSAARRAWWRLSPEERRAALDGLDEWEASLPPKRGAPTGLATYLAEQRWVLAKARREHAEARTARGAEPPVVAKGERVAALGGRELVGPITRPWWLMLASRVAGNTEALLGKARFQVRMWNDHGAGFVPAEGDWLPSAEDQSACVQLAVDSAEAMAWLRFYRDVGIVLRRPIGVPYLWAPAAWPPAESQRAPFPVGLQASGSGADDRAKAPELSMASTGSEASGHG